MTEHCKWRKTATTIQKYHTSPVYPLLFCIAQADDTGQGSGGKS